MRTGRSAIPADFLEPLYGISFRSEQGQDFHDTQRVGGAFSHDSFLQISRQVSMLIYVAKYTLFEGSCQGFFITSDRFHTLRWRPLLTLEQKKVAVERTGLLIANYLNNPDQFDHAHTNGRAFLLRTIIVTELLPLLDTIEKNNIALRLPTLRHHIRNLKPSTPLVEEIQNDLLKEIDLLDGYFV